MRLTSAEKFVCQRFATDVTEQRQNMLLLAKMLPAAIAEKLRLNPGRHIAQSHEEVSILFADVVGFTAMSEKLEGTDK